LAFEKDHLDQFVIQGKTTISIDQNDKDAEGRTVEAMREGIDIIYQARLKDDVWQGWADFLVKVSLPSGFGNYSYEVWDTKLANDTKASTILQIGLYSEIVGNIQGVLPEYMCVQKPEGTERFRVDDFIAYVRYVKKQFLASVSESVNTYPEPCNTCDICAWWDVCNQQRRTDDHLAFIAGMGKAQIKEVRSHNINTLAAMADLSLPLPFIPKRGSAITFEKLREQARLQKQSRDEKKPIYELLPRVEGLGLFQLPEPSKWDIYLDLEGDPLVEPAGREYIIGWYYQDSYNIIWAEDASSEKAAFEHFVDFACKLQQEHPEMHIYHFGAYEPSAFKRLMSRYATKEEEMDCLLRSGCFIDLHSITKQSLRAGVERYSLKDLEKYHGYVREMDLRNLSGYKAEYEFLLETNKCADATEEMREAIRLYNQDDCISTQNLHKWLERERQQLVNQGENIPRPVPKDGTASEKVTEHLKRIKPIYEKLMAGLPVDEAERTPEQQACFILAHFLDWYRREQKSFWWEFFRVTALDTDDLLDERTALTGLVYTGESSDDKRSKVYTYSFPAQEADFRIGTSVKDRDNKTAGTVVDIDYDNLLVRIKKGPSLKDVHHETVFNLEQFSTTEKENRIIELGEWVAANDINSQLPDFQVARHILMRLKPCTADTVKESSNDVLRAIEWATKLERSYLPIQGPPGAGKSYTGSHIITELIK